MAIDNYKVLQEQHDRYIYCRDEGHLQFQKKAKTCEKFFSGEQWDEATKAKLKQQRRPALTLNKTLSSLMVMFAEQLKNRASVNFVPSSNGSQDVANIFNKLWLYTASTNKLKWVESQVFDDGIITGRGFYDIRMDFSNHLLGEVAINHVNPLNVIIDPDSEEYDPDSWSDTFYSKWLSLEDVQRIYGKEKAESVRRTVEKEFPLGYDYIDTRPDTFGGDEAARYTTYTDSMQDYRKRVRVLERQYKQVQTQEHFVDLETGDMSLVPEGMPREKIQAILNEFNVTTIKRPADVYYWTVTAGDTVLHHKESPYKHFTIIPFFPVFRRGKTIGMVENLIDPQELYNKARSQELHVINTSANSGWITKRGAVLNLTTEELEERGAETGLVLETDDVDNVKKITPNPIPTGLDRVSQIAGEDLKEISMASDSMRGFDREDVAAKAIQAKQQVGGKNFAKVMDNLAHTRTLLAERALDLMQTFYTTEREFQITGESLRAESEAININVPDQEQPSGVLNDITVGKYSVVVTTVPDRDTIQQTNFEQAVQLRELGVPIPDKILIENSTLENKEELLEEKPDPAVEKQRQLELADKEAEVSKKEAERDKLHSEAALNLVRAQRDGEEAKNKALEDPNAGNGVSPDAGPDWPTKFGHVQKMRELDLKEQEQRFSILSKNRELDLKEQELKKKDTEAAAPKTTKAT